MRLRLSIVLAASTSAMALGGLAQAADITPSSASEEVIVTGERTNRSLRETSSSVAVSTADDIAKAAGVFSINDLLDRIANVVSTEPGNDMPAVRGLDGTGPGGGPTAFFAGSRPRLSYQVDGRTLSFNETAFANTSLWDVAQVEVYRGPQSTLQGRNAIAGVVAITTVAPDFTWSGAGRVVVGGGDTVQMSGALGGPIADGIAAFRISADWQRSESFVDFEGYPGASDPGRYDVKTYRAKLLLTPTEGIRSLLSLSYQDGREPQSNWVKRPFEDQTSINEGLYQPVFRARTTTAISDTSFALSDAFDLQLYLSAGHFRINRYAPAGTGVADISRDEYTVQPILRYRSGSGSISGLVGIYLFRTHQDETIDLLGGGGYRDEADTNAIFGEVTYRPTDTLSIVLGARYEEEKRYRLGATGFLATDFDASYREFMPKATVSLDATPNLTVGVSVARGYNAGGAGITLAPPFTGYTYDPEYVWTYEAFVRAQLADDLTLNGNVFFSDYEDLQLPFYLSPLSTVIRNAEEATTYGAEIELAWRPSARNQVYARVGLLETKINTYSDPLVEGNALPRAPAFSLSAGFTYSPDDRFEIGADIHYSAGYHSDVLNTPRARVDGYAIVNARIAYDIEPARLFLAVRNAFDNGDPILLGVLSDSPLNDYAVLPEPRRVFAGIEFSF